MKIIGLAMVIGLLSQENLQFLKEKKFSYGKSSGKP
jgi:hypothetical protein